MDHPNLNMRQRQWLDAVKDYDCEMLYHPEKDTVMADALSRKVAPIRDICLRKTVVTPLLEQIPEAQQEAMKEEHRKSERIVGQVSSFNYDSRGLLTIHRRCESHIMEVCAMY